MILIMTVLCASRSEAPNQIIIMGQVNSQGRKLSRFPSQPIRICHVAMADLWGGAEVYLVTLIRRLRVMPGLVVSAILFNEGRLAEELRSLGIPVTIIPECKNNATSILCRLLRHFRANPCDVVHTHKPKDNFLGALAGLFFRKIHIVRTLHGAPEPFQGIKSIKMEFYEFLDRVAIKLMISRVILVSSDLRNRLDKKWALGRTECVHNGIEPGRFKVQTERSLTRRELGVDEEDRLIGAVGRLSAVKGHELLIRAAAVLLSSECKIKVVLVGDGPLLGPLRELADSLGILNHVLFVGHQDNVQKFLAATDIFVLPSLHEGMPMALLEALAMELPVVATRVGGIPEVVDHGVNGLLVTPADVQSLLESIRALIDDPFRASRLGKAGRARIEKEFTAEHMAERMAEIYASLSHSQ